MKKIIGGIFMKILSKIVMENCDINKVSETYEMMKNSISDAKKEHIHLYQRFKNGIDICTIVKYED